MKKNDDNWWDFVARRKAPLPQIPPFRPEPIEETSTIEVEESPGVDGADTIIQKVKRFWAI